LGLEAAYNRTALIIKFGPIVYTLGQAKGPKGAKETPGLTYKRSKLMMALLMAAFKRIVPDEPPVKDIV
jgi:hypothetical protein